MIEYQRVELPSVKLNVALAGPADAPVLILLHGWPESHRAWSALVPHLGDEFRLVMPDQRGFGGSGRPIGTEAYSMGVLVGDVAALVAWTGAESVGLVGHDFGGAVAWASGAFIPDSLDRIVVLASPHPMRMRAAALENPRQIALAFYVWLLHSEAGERLLAAGDFELLASWAFAGTEAVDANLRRAYRDEWSQPGAFHAMAEWYRANYTPDLFNPEVPLLLPPVRVPVRYLHAAADLAFVPEVATGSGEWVDAPYDEQVVAGTTHWMVHERPEEIACLIREWMRP